MITTIASNNQLFLSDSQPKVAHLSKQVDAFLKELENKEKLLEYLRHFAFHQEKDPKELYIRTFLQKPFLKCHHEKLVDNWIRTTLLFTNHGKNHSIYQEKQIHQALQLLDFQHVFPYLIAGYRLSLLNDDLSSVEFFRQKIVNLIDDFPQEFEKLNLIHASLAEPPAIKFDKSTVPDAFLAMLETQERDLLLQKKISFWMKTIGFGLLSTLTFGWLLREVFPKEHHYAREVKFISLPSPPQSLKELPYPSTNTSITPYLLLGMSTSIFFNLCSLKSYFFKKQLTTITEQQPTPTLQDAPLTQQQQTIQQPTVVPKSPTLSKRINQRIANLTPHTPKTLVKKLIKTLPLSVSADTMTNNDEPAENPLEIIVENS